MPAFFRFAILTLAAPLVLGACRDNADPVKPKVSAVASGEMSQKVSR